MRSDIFFISIILIGIGVFNLFFGDVAWSWRESRNRSKGIPNSERTPEWENERQIVGTDTLIGGLIIFIFGVKDAAPDPVAFTMVVLGIIACILIALSTFKH